MMAAETMSSDERVWAAIRLEKPDRVPVIPTLLPEPAAGLRGLSQAQIAADNRLAVETVFAVFDEYGGWDNPYPAAYTPIQLQVAGVFPLRVRIPGRDLDDDHPFQLDEQPILQPADYDIIAEVGFERFYYDDFLWRITDLERERLPATLEELASGFGLFATGCARRERRPFFIAAALHPFFTLSLMRSMVEFTKDLHYNPAPVERALRRMTDDLIARQPAAVRQSGVALGMITEERASAFFYPPQVFERFWWPYTREIVDAMWSEGLVTLFHLDQCWDRNIPYFRDLPRVAAVLELDGTTNIFAAAEALRGHHCLKGDVPAALLSIGSPAEVTDYCTRLIREVGGEGGFILGSGCSVPPDVRPENFRTMIETAKAPQGGSRSFEQGR